MSLLNRQVAKPTLFKRFSQSGNQLTFSVNFSLSSFRFAAIKHYLCGVLLTVITLTSQSVATEFIVMRLPHGWMIGADSLETGPNGSAKTVCKIQQVHKFVILRYGHSGKTGNPTFNLDEALEKSVSPETTQEGAFRAAREVVDSAMIRMMRAHLHNKEIHYPSTLPDDKFADSVDIAFVLLSIEKDEPKIDNYVAYPGDYTSMQVAHYEERTLTKTKLKYVPAIFSFWNRSTLRNC